MPVDTISVVTDSIITIMQSAIDASGFFNPPGSTVVSPDLPIRQDATGLGFYLYHVVENVHYKNAFPPGNDFPPVNYTPMGLNLYYQLSANYVSTDNKSASTEQRMMSVALKALHDNAEITLSTGDNVRISLQTIQPADAVHIWTAGPSPMKLSAFYEVAVVLLVPEIPKLYTGRVITYGNYIFTMSALRIVQIENQVTLRIPGELNDRQITVQPAQTSFGEDIDIIGSGFDGQHIELLITSKGWVGNALADRVAWSVKVTSTGKLTATIQRTAVLIATGASINILPGMYGAQINAPRTITFPDGGVRKFPHLSNIFPFTVSPLVTIVSGPIAGVVNVTGYPFLDPVLLTPPENMQIYIGDDLMTLVNAAGFVAGTCQVMSLTTLKIFLPAGLSPGENYPLRILIGGAESRPIWVMA